METAPLKSFAIWARTALIREVSARIAAVLAPASKERVESASAIAALERDVVAAGGGQTGRDAIADKVSYTWFNRIIALRFMDANGYTGIGIASPQRGQIVGQPEVLADAKRGNIDPAVFTNKSTIEEITALLDGTRRSDDPQGEAYALLLAEYCRHWNRSMPFMFEREGDYTELLIPANLLADDSVLARAVTVLTEEVCQDVEVIGWLYQFYISERKDEVFAGFKKNKKAGAAEIPAATQLFTPHWIVRYLVENSLGRLWLLNHPESNLAEQMEYYIAPVDEETDFVRVASPEELRIIDPAVGSGHMLTYAFDLLYAIYAEQGYAPSEIPGLILQHNLYGTEIDPRAGALAAFALAMKARAKVRTFFAKGTQPNICVLEPIHFDPSELDYLWSLAKGARIARADVDEFWNAFEHADTIGSLIKPKEALIPLLRPIIDQLEVGGNLLGRSASKVIRQAEQLSKRYDVVVANPPYMGSRRMDDALARYMTKEFAEGAQDLYSAFILRACSLAKHTGRVAMIAMQSWMFLSTFESLRRHVLRVAPPTSVANLGPGAFDSIGGAVVSTAAFVLQPGGDAGRRAVFVSATAGANEAEKSSVLRGEAASQTVNTSVKSPGELLSLPGAVFGYWASPALAKAYATLPRIESIADARQGLSTANDARFLRQWFEVSLDQSSISDPDNREVRSRARWIPCNKGGSSRRWYGNHEYVIDWARGGEVLRDPNTGASIRNASYYFRESVSWSNIGGVAAFRYFPPGFIFNAKGMSLFPHQESQIFDILGYLNSGVAREALELVAPINSIEVGHVNTLPAPEFASSPELIEEAVSIAKLDWDSAELSWEFTKPEILEFGSGPLRSHFKSMERREASRASRLRNIELENDRCYESSLGITELSSQTLDQETLRANDTDPTFSDAADGEHSRSVRTASLVSYAVGCMLGRYSLDAPGLILANQGDTLQEFLAQVPSPSFLPDKDNVIPIVDGDWFEDDIVARFRQFLRVAFGEEHFEENLRFVTESLGVKDLRDYFVKSFYKNHVQRYKKRPIYWLFSSPKGAFNALIYMHRYTPSTVSTVLNEYLREFKAKLDASRQHHERLALGTGTPRDKAAAEKEVDRLRKVLLELDEYEHDVLYPLATHQLAIDLDDGVKVNYPKFADALKSIPGLEASDE